MATAPVTVTDAKTTAKRAFAGEIFGGFALFVSLVIGHSYLRPAHLPLDGTWIQRQLQ